MIYQKLNKGELALLEVLEHPLWCSEFLRQEEDPTWEHTKYQKEVLLDCGNYVSFRAARSTGKTETLVDLLVYFSINDFFITHTVALTTPNRVHLTPIWRKLTRWLGFHHFLKHFRSTINSQTFTLGLLNGVTIDCRIAGLSGTGASVIGLHTPVILVDECLLGSQRIAGVSGNKEIRRAKVGDKILSWDGEKVTKDRISSVRRIPNKEKILKISFGNTSIKASKEHRFYSQNRYIEAKELNIGDSLFFYENNKRSSWSEEELNGVILRVKSGEDAPTIAADVHRSPQAVYKKLFSVGLSTKKIQRSSITQRQLDIITGSLLGDGSSQTYVYASNYNTNHSYKQKKYVDWLYSELEDLCRTPPRVSTNFGWGAYSYSFGTLSHPKIKNLSDSLYINNKKTITKEYLEKLTPLGLAIWFADDGSASGMFSTHSFSETENELISNYLFTKWGILNNVRYDKRTDLYFIGISVPGMRRLREIILEHLPECMHYKLGIGDYNNTIPDLPDKTDDNTQELEEVVITNIEEIFPKSKYLYSIEVENNHNYFANGILTKNSGYYPFLVWTELQPTLNTWENGHRLYVCGTPSGQREDNVLYYADIESDQYNKHRVSSFDNPRYTEDDDIRNQQQYGGADSDDYQRLVLGEHASPVTVLFAKDTLPLGTFNTFTATLTNEDLERDPEKVVRLLNSIPREDGIIAAGVDLGYSDPTIISMFVNSSGPWRHFARIELQHIEYPKQIKFLDKLDDIYNFTFLAIDEGHAGIAVSQEMTSPVYLHKNYAEKLVPISFSGTVEIGNDLDGNPIKVQVRNLSTEKLRSLFDNKIVILSANDQKLLSELEHVEGTRTSTGATVYRVRTPGGSLRGEDHIFSSFLCFAYAMYMREDFQTYKPKAIKLFGARWAK